MIRTLLASTAGILAAGTAAAGGYVAAIPQVAPTVAVSPSAGQWMIGAALLAGTIALLGRDSGGNNFSSTPIDHGGPCFLSEKIRSHEDKYVELLMSDADDVKQAVIAERLEYL